ncbi:DUF2490 domain-containing protein [Polaribacter porphyrae]|uniref:DUF2490 domain-containing protein n=1 Tax=Polaribacter porphyrae TaxID=1137780 RepID=A0A2S7WMQ1_9FLAO|nr:DUF2490 domain-containing protein [Polaribacter porphyrae]PQJ78863.1 hypothetical protein BTO18_06545 [Polaribacter porphyrae]
MNIIKIEKMSLLKIMLFCTIFFICNTKAQTERDKDWASWTTIALEYKLNDTWSFGLEEQFRLKENFSTVDEFFTELTTEYKLFKGLKLGVGLSCP